MTEILVPDDLRNSESLGRADLSDLTSVADDAIPLAETALRLGLCEYPNLDPAVWLDEIDAFADRARRLSDSRTEGDVLTALDTVLFDHAGFSGNAALYYDPRNSFLSDVIERRTGIPISLSVLYIETGRRLGLTLRGIGFPGHFLVGHDSAAGSQIIDPFNQGRRLDRAACERMLEAQGLRADTLDDTALGTVSNRHIIVRMLTNLKIIYLKQNDLRRAVSAMTRILQLAPTAIHQLKERGLVYLKSGQLDPAVRDLEAYLGLSASTSEKEEIRTAIVNARRSIARFN